MNPTGRELINELELISHLDWYRYSRTTGDKGAIYAASLVWRFTSEEAESPTAKRIVETLHQVVKDFSGNVSWSLRFQGRNWVLAPAMLFEIEDSKRFRTDIEVLHHLQELDPNLGVKTVADIAAIAIRFKQMMSM